MLVGHGIGQCRSLDDIDGRIVEISRSRSTGYDRYRAIDTVRT